MSLKRRPKSDRAAAVNRDGHRAPSPKSSRNTTGSHRRLAHASADPLRLVRPPIGAGPLPATPSPQSIVTASDPRWVLAVRTAEAMEGSIVGPEARGRLMRLGRVMGLSPFDCSLIIAIMQDRARRGISQPYLTHAAEPQLAMVAPARRGLRALARRDRAWTIAVLAALFLTAQLFVLWWLF